MRCLETGYYGRVGTFEMFYISNQIRQLLEEKATNREVRELARKQGMMTLREVGREVVMQGRTTTEEIIRVTT